MLKTTCHLEQTFIIFKGNATLGNHLVCDLIRTIYYLLIYFTGINLLEKELLSLVHHKYRDLITQGTWVEELEDTLKLMRTHLQVFTTLVNFLICFMRL